MGTMALTLRNVKGRTLFASGCGQHLFVFFRIKLDFIIHTLHRKGDLVNRAELYEKQLGWSALLCLHTEAALFSQPWAHLEQPAGQQEVHL